jgi:DnaJ homologue, subfamily C, member 28, conserved domain
MIDGFSHIVEERIRQAQRRGEFDNLRGQGQPIRFDDDGHIPEDLRMAYKILKNADCLPPELEMKKEIHQTKDLLAGMPESAEKLKLMQRLNFLIMKLNTVRNGNVAFEAHQVYTTRMVDRMAENRRNPRKA